MGLSSRHCYYCGICKGLFPYSLCPWEELCANYSASPCLFLLGSPAECVRVCVWWMRDGGGEGGKRGKEPGRGSGQRVVSSMAYINPNLSMALKVWEINVELNMHEPVSAYTLLLAAIISQLYLSTTWPLIPGTVATCLLTFYPPSFHLHQYYHSNTVVTCPN